LINLLRSKKNEETRGLLISFHDFGSIFGRLVDLTTSDVVCVYDAGRLTRDGGLWRASEQFYCNRTSYER